MAMNGIRAILYGVVFGLTLPSFAVSDELIFRCLEKNDYNCLVSEAAQSDRWKYAVNSKGETAVQMGIRLGTLKLTKVLANFGAPVSVDDVTLAMREHFGVDPAFFADATAEDTIVKIKRDYQAITSPAKDMIKAITDDMDSEDIWYVASALDLFTARTNLALYITGAALTREISITVAMRLLRNYDYLFFLGKPLSRHNLKSIVKTLLPLGVESIVLRIILDAKEKANGQVTRIKKLARGRLKLREPHRALAAAIMEQSRSDLSAISLKDLVQQKTRDKKFPAIGHAIDFQNRLMTFVSQSIVYPKSPVAKLNNYGLWHRVYKTLIKHGDFASGLSIAVGLANSAVVRSIPVNDQKLQDLSEITDNYRGYRNLLREMPGEFLLPSIAVLGKDLTFTAELPLLMTVDEEQRLNMDAIRFYARMRYEFERYQKSADNFRIHCSPKLQNALSKLPPVNTETADSAWRHAYQTLIVEI